MRNKKEKRISPICLPDESHYHESLYNNKQYEFFPEIKVGYEGVLDVISCIRKCGVGGLDFEFDPRTNIPYIIGVSSIEDPDNPQSGKAASCTFDLNLLRAVYDTNAKIVAYSGTDADRLVTDSQLQFTTSIDRWVDPLIKHYLCNPQFCSAPGKSEDDDDHGALGLLNLWSCASLYTDLTQWKDCYGDKCVERICPIHHVFGYCAIDAFAGLAANFSLDKEMQAKQIPQKLYHELVDVTIFCHEMTKKGIKIDREYVAKLEKEFQENKNKLYPFETRKKKKYFGKWGDPDEYGEVLWENALFNPNSPKQVIEYFKAQKISLKGKGGRDSVRKEDLIKVLNRSLHQHKDTKYYDFDIKQLGIVNDTGDIVTIHEYQPLVDLISYKAFGKGLKGWMNEDYFGDDDYIHARFITCGTAPGRLSSSKPNFQNLPRVGWGAKVRRALMVSAPLLDWIKADVGGLEYRICFWYAGEKIAPDKIFEDLVNASNGMFAEAAKLRGFTARDVAKSIVHAGNYLEGLTVLYDEDFSLERTQKAIQTEALEVHYDWKYRGGIVAFTGANLAERLFGKRGFEERSKALRLQKSYFDTYPFIHDWHKSLSQKIEMRGYVRAINGHRLPLEGSPEDDLKLAAAFLGQGGGAIYVREAMLKYKYLNEIPNIQVHDELGFQKPKSWTNDECKKFMSIMSEPSEYFNGLSCPIKVYRGNRYIEYNDKTGQEGDLKPI